MGGGDSALFAAAAQKLAEEFGSVTATAVAHPLGAADAGPPAAAERSRQPLQPGQMRRRLDQLIEANQRYEHPFALVVFDVDGPAARSGEDRDGGRETALAVVGAALRESVRMVDETFRLEEDALCVLAPNQDTVGGVQMAERLLRQLDELEDAGGPAHRRHRRRRRLPRAWRRRRELLHKADEAMWRARAVGQPVGVGALRRLCKIADRFHEICP